METWVVDALKDMDFARLERVLWCEKYALLIAIMYKYFFLISSLFVLLLCLIAGTSIDQGVAYVLMLVALVLTYLIHPLDASSYSFFWVCSSITAMEFDAEWGLLCAFAFLENISSCDVVPFFFLHFLFVFLLDEFFCWNISDFAVLSLGFFFLSCPKSHSSTLPSLWLVEITYQCLSVFQPIIGIMFTWLWPCNQILFHRGILGWSHP